MVQSSTQLVDFTNLVVTYSITLSGNTNEYDVIFRSLAHFTAKGWAEHDQIRAYGCGVRSSGLGSRLI